MTADQNNAMQQILEQAVDAVVSIDENNCVTFFNRAAEALWGLKSDQVMGKNVAILVPRALQAGHDGFVNANRETGVDKIVGTSRAVMIERVDGKTVHASLSLSKVMIDGRITYTAFVKDETATFQERERTRQILEQAIDAVVTIDGANHVTFFNAAAERLWGYSRDDVIGRNVAMLVPAALRASHDDLVNANRTTGVDKIVGTSREVEIHRADGQMRWGNLALSKVQIGDEISYTAFVRDVTEEVERRTQFETLSLVANETDNSVIICDAEGKIEYVNPGFTRMTGYEFDEVKGKKPGSFLQGPRTDQETVSRIRERIRNREPFYDEILNYHKSGQAYWISLAINPVFDAEGNLTKFISIQANIDATKLAALEFNAKLDAIGETNAIVELGLDGTVLAGNETFLKTMGYTADEVVGKHHRMFVEPSYAKSREYEEFWKKMKRGEALSATIKRVAKGGREIWLQGSYNPIFDLDGRPKKVVKFAIDVTEEKTRNLEFTAKLDAIDRSNVVVELDLDGTIQAVNEKALGLLGHRAASDVIGRRFLDLCQAPSEVAAVVGAAAEGRSSSTELSLADREGRIVWLSCAVNPILDLNGRPRRVFVYGDDVTANKETRQATDAILIESKRVMEALAGGDLTQRVAGRFEGDFKTLQDAVNGCCERLQDLVTQIRVGSASISDNAEMVAQGNSSLNSRTVEQASSLEETAASMEEMTATVQANADNAREASRLAQDARDRADAGGKVVNNAIAAMNEIDDSSKRIADIIVVIDEIAFQTNLLALNAAVEAARAGDKGRGFSVVATEVRNLAQRSADAAREIKGLIRDSVRKVEEGTRLVNASSNTLESIMDGVKQVTEIVTAIAGASVEQSEGINQINKAVCQMDSVTQQNAALVEEATAASEVLKNEAKSLLDVIQFFAGSGAESAAAPSPAALESARRELR